jgi:TadE-like protein
MVRREEGQAVVEFAIILFPLLLLVAGIIQFGIAVNFWQDQQRLAAQGARVAIVNCAQAAWCTPTLEQYLEGQTLSNGNKPQATVCFVSRTGENGTVADPGDSVTVYLESPFKLVPIFGVGTIMISARTTMRLEQKATHAGIAAAPVCP